MQAKVRAKLQAVAQLAAAGLTPATIREQLGIPLGTYKRLIGMPEYRELAEQLVAERTAEIEAQSALSVEAIQAKVREELSATVNRLLSLRASKNERVALEACKDLLDRDPSRALQKVSRTSFGKPVEVKDLSYLDKEGDQLIADMNAQNRKQAEREGRLAEYEAELAKRRQRAEEGAKRNSVQ
jgi:hypothetical protein